MMRIIFLVMLPMAWSYGATQGGGAFAYVDSSGNRYGGTYGLKDGKVISSNGDAFPVPFADTAYQGDDFGFSYFSNLENLLQDPSSPQGSRVKRVFKSNIDNQRLAFDAARKAFDLTSNQAAGYYPNPNIASRFGPLNHFPEAGFPFGGFPLPAMPNYGNSAFASAAAGPGYQHQVASIYPNNPNNPNVDTVNHYSDKSVPSNGGFYTVSSKSFATSSNINGKEVSNRGSETMVNENGKITHYKVRS